MYHSHDEKNPNFFVDSEESGLELSPEELELLRILARDRIKFMDQQDNPDDDTELPYHP